MTEASRFKSVPTQIDPPKAWEVWTLEDDHDDRWSRAPERHYEGWPRCLRPDVWAPSTSQPELPFTTLLGEVHIPEQRSREALGTLNDALSRTLERLTREWTAYCFSSRLSQHEAALAQLSIRVNALDRVEALLSRALGPQVTGSPIADAGVTAALDWSNLESVVAGAVAALDWDVRVRIDSESGHVDILAQSLQLDLIADQTGQFYSALAEGLSPEAFEAVEVEFSFDADEFPGRGLQE